MARRIEERIADLTSVVEDGGAPALLALEKALTSKHSLLVAAAAELAARAELDALTDDIVRAFSRIAGGGTKADKGCYAKLALVRALIALDYVGVDVYEQGVALVQREPVWGGSEDTAAALRIASAEGLAAGGFVDLPTVLAHLLADDERSVRVAAARIAAYAGQASLSPLVRLRALSGDEPDVLAECLGTVLAIEPEKGLDFVVEFLDHQDDAIGDVAALALGGTRSERALAALREWHERTAGMRRETVMLAIASLRIEPGYEFLTRTIADGPEPSAIAAIEALATYRDIDAIRERARVAVDERADPEIARAFNDRFGA